MSDPFLGQLTAVGFNFAPRGWAHCDGQLLPISQYSALFSLLGTTYGGDGRTTFGLPDLRGRSIVSPGNGPGLSSIRWGEKGGAQDSVLTAANLASHTHGIGANTGSGTADSPSNAYMATAEDANRNGINIYGTTKAGQMAPTDATGNGQSFTNRSPFLGCYWCIALVGQYPSRS